MSLIGDLGNPEKDEAAFKPLADELEAKLMVGVQAALMSDADRLLAGLRCLVSQQLPEALDGLAVTITITVTKKKAA